MLVEGVSLPAIRQQGSYLDCKSFDEVEKRLKARWIMLKGKVTHKPNNAGEITRYFVWKHGPKPKVRLETAPEMQQAQTPQPPPQQIYLPAPKREPVIYKPTPDPVSFLADVAGLTTIKEEDVFSEKAQPYTYKEPLSKKQLKKEQRALERAAKAAALRTAN